MPPENRPLLSEEQDAADERALIAWQTTLDNIRRRTTERLAADPIVSTPAVETRILRVRYVGPDDAYEVTTVSGHVFRIQRTEVEDIGLLGGRSLGERLQYALTRGPRLAMRWDESAYADAQAQDRVVAASRLYLSESDTPIHPAFVGVDRIVAPGDDEPANKQKEWLEDILDLMRAYDASAEPEFDAEVIRYIKSMSHTIQAALISLGALDD